MQLFDSRTSPRRGVRCWSIATVALASLVSTTFADASSTAPSTEDIEFQVNQIMRLTDSDIVLLDVTPELDRVHQIQVTLGGAPYTMEIAPHSVRSENYEVIAIDADGNRTPVAPAPVNTFRGTLLNQPGSVVTASFLEDGLIAKIDMANDASDRFWLEPVGQRVANVPADTYVVYHQDDVIPVEGTCGTEGADTTDFGAAGIDPRNQPIVQFGSAGLCTTELACDADYEYYQDRGFNTTNVQNRINSVINSINAQYEQDVAITHVISTILIRTSSGSPYTSASANTLLNQFRNEWQSNQQSVQRDVAHLFTGKSIDGSTIGIAYNIGAICSSSAYCLSESDCCGSFACATDLTAHELGHLWGAFHCNGYCDATMNASIQCANEFTSGSITSISNHRNSRNCLDCVAPDAYCNASSSNSFNRFITRFEIADIDNASSGSGYADFSGVTTELVRGQTYTATVTLGGNNGSSTIGGMWIDRTRDVDFADFFEDVETAWSGSGPYEVTFAVSGYALGATTLRVRIQDSDQNNVMQPCGTTSRGEVEDYTVIIVDPPMGACCFPEGCIEDDEGGCTFAGGTFLGVDTFCTDCVPPCPSDIDQDGATGFSDLTTMLSAWGDCGVCPEDLNDDGAVGFSDLTQLLADWGPC